MIKQPDAPHIVFVLLLMAMVCTAAVPVLTAQHESTIDKTALLLRDVDKINRRALLDEVGTGAAKVYRVRETVRAREAEADTTPWVRRQLEKVYKRGTAPESVLTGMTLSTRMKTIRETERILDKLKSGTGVVQWTRRRRVGMPEVNTGTTARVRKTIIPMPKGIVANPGGTSDEE